MVAGVRSLGLDGISGYEVRVECFLSGGLPGFDIVGLPDTAVREARERVQAAIKNCGAEVPSCHIVVNLAPADRRKAGTVYDLPILVGLLAAGSALPPVPEEAAFLGEVSLAGEVRRVNGVLPMALAARDRGVRALFVPRDNAREATLAGGEMAVYGVDHVSALAGHLLGRQALAPTPPWSPEGTEVEDGPGGDDLRDVMGQPMAKRALEIAAAGGHNLLMIGFPGSGKSMLAKCLPSILPDMTREESLETTAVWSVAGMTDPRRPLLRRRPFRSPHHSASASAMTGGGATLRPGEISLAHNGVLFLDELPEFRRDALEALRQPMESGDISVTRASGRLHLPARFQLVCAMNPCRCGWRGHPSGRCTCTRRDAEKYVEKISGPLLDRVDLHVRVAPVEYEDMRRRESPEPSAAVRERVEAARAIQLRRFAGTDVACNAQMTPAMVGRFCPLGAAEDDMMRSAFENMGLTARSHDRVLRVARTIADLDGAAEIGTRHLAEAVHYRNTDILRG